MIKNEGWQIQLAAATGRERACVFFNLPASGLNSIIPTGQVFDFSLGPPRELV